MSKADEHGTSSADASHTQSGGPSLPLWLRVDPFRVALRSLRRWPLALIAGVAFAAAGYVAASRLFDSSYWVETQLLRQGLPNSFQASENGQAYRPRELADGTIIGLMTAPSLLDEIGTIADPPVEGSVLLANLSVRPERKTDLIRVTLTDGVSPEQAARLLNHYSERVVALTRQMQQEEASELNRHLQSELGKVRRELTDSRAEAADFAKSTGHLNADEEIRSYLHQLGSLGLRLESARIERQTIDRQIERLKEALSRQNPAAIQLEEAEARLQALLVNYTDVNPKVREQKSVIETLRANLEKKKNNGDSAPARTGSQLGDSLYIDIITLESRRETLERELEGLEAYRTRLADKLESVPARGRAYAELTARIAALENTESLLAARQREAQMFAASSPGYYRTIGRVSVDHVSTSSPIKKILAVTAAGGVGGAALMLLLSLLLELIDRRVYSAADFKKVSRAERVWSFTTDASDEERALQRRAFETWLSLEKNADDGRGNVFCALVSSAATQWAGQLARSARDRGYDVLLAKDGATEDEATGLNVMHLPTNWLRNADQRDRLHSELINRADGEKQAVLVALPEADSQEAAIVAGALGNVIWMGASGETERLTLAGQVELLRAAGCRVIGGILNGEPRWLNRISRILAPALAAMSLLAAPMAEVRAAESVTTKPAAAQAAPPAKSFFGTRKARRARWQRSYKLGPGDVLNFSVYGRYDANRKGVAVGPDGRISFMDARNIMAAGLTIDELRAKVDAELAKHFRNARSIVIPHTIKSKKYFLMGSVVDQGAYTLTHGMTILEAVAKARGLATGLYYHNTVELADLPRCFVVRDGERLPVDFVKLFNEGDLSQNLPVEPDDFIYLPSSGINEVYVLGAVNFPGALGVSGNSTALSVIAVQAGFAEMARKGRILVVRGSLQEPEVFTVDTAAILAGKEKDFLLEPKDIIYVPERTTARLEELTDAAIKAFIGASVSTWTGRNIGPALQQQIIPDL